MGQKSASECPRIIKFTEVRKIGVVVTLHMSSTAI